MLEIRQLKLPVTHSENDIAKKLAKILSSKSRRISSADFSYSILKKSIDCRKKPDLYFIYSVAVEFNDRNIKESYIISENNKKKGKDKAEISIYEPVYYKLPYVNDSLVNDIGRGKIPRPVIIGAGPAGLFAAYILALCNLKPTIFERGQAVENRTESVNEFIDGGNLDPNSNIQFGEGGAGTFSDGKLNTLTRDKFGRQTFIFDTFVEFGADSRIKYDYKPHVGTDVLSIVIKNLREKIISLGGEFHFDTLVNGFDIINDSVVSLTAKCINKANDPLRGNSVNVLSVPAQDVILATGHSARDTFLLFQKLGVNMEQKSFAVGFRVQHPQKMINNSQYGEGYPENLEASPYKVANTASNGRRVYSFCMCPGGYVINSSSEENRLCVNGMSYSMRDSDFANSAIIIGVDHDDFIKAVPDMPSDDPLLGMYYQRKLEEKAFNLGRGMIPAERFTDYENSMPPSDFDTHNARGLVSKADLRGLLSDDMEEAFIESMHHFGHMIDGFDSDNAIMYGVESRTSSPVKIPRNDEFMSSIKGIYPCGEGAGYAGGIISAAVDGIKVAEAVINNLNKRYS